MKPVKKIGQACVLACLESFYLDNNFNMTQQMLINHLKPLGLSTDNGIVCDISKVAKALGLNLAKINSNLPVGHNLKNNEAIIFLLEGINGDGRHCIRFSKNIANNGIEAMDPDSNNPDCLENYDYGRLTSGQLNPAQFNIYKITIPVP